MWNFLDYDQPWAPDATRYEGGRPDFTGALSLATSIGVFQRAEVARIAAAGFVTTNRPSGIRISSHGYTTSDEIYALLEVV